MFNTSFGIIISSFSVIRLLNASLRQPAQRSCSFLRFNGSCIYQHSIINRNHQSIQICNRFSSSSTTNRIHSFRNKTTRNILVHKIRHHEVARAKILLRRHRGINAIQPVLLATVLCNSRYSKLVVHLETHVERVQTGHSRSNHHSQYPPSPSHVSDTLHDIYLWYLKSYSSFCTTNPTPENAPHWMKLSYYAKKDVTMRDAASYNPCFHYKSSIRSTFSLPNIIRMKNLVRFLMSAGNIVITIMRFFHQRPKVSFWV